jgi:hypothetical protein
MPTRPYLLASVDNVMAAEIKPQADSIDIQARKQTD